MEGDSPPREAKFPPPAEIAPILGVRLYPLLVTARTGDQAAVEKFLEHARERITGRLRMRTGHGSAAPWMEDIAQDALLDAFRGLPNCRASDEVQIRAWIGRIADRQLGLYWRRESARIAAEVDLDPDLVSDPPDERDPPSPTTAALTRQLDIALRGLTPAQHDLLYVRVILSGTWEDVARAVGSTRSGAKRRFQRLVLRLRAMLT